MLTSLIRNLFKHSIVSYRLWFVHFFPAAFFNKVYKKDKKIYIINKVDQRASLHDELIHHGF